MISRAFIRIILLNALGALSTHCVMAQTQAPAARTDRSAAPVAAVIKGRVVNESGQPLANAIISARPTTTNESLGAATDRDGAFQLNEVEPGLSYYVNAVMPAYTSPPREQGAPTPTYRAGDSITFTLIKGAVITGTVTNAVGEPVVAVRVGVERVVRDRNGRRLGGGDPAVERLTDDRGVYRLYGLPAGTYVVRAGGASRYYSSSMVDVYETDVPTYANSNTRDTAAEVTVRAGEEINGVDIRYRAEQGRLISGVVTGATRGFNVVLTNTEDAAASSASSYPQMDDSSFSFVGVAEGDYDVYAYSYSETRDYGVSEVKRIRLRGADVTGIELATRPLGSVSGRVVLDETKPPECGEKSRPSADMTIGAWHNDTDQAKETPQTIWNMGAPVKPDAEGNFLMRNLATGEYYFAVRSAGKNWYVRSIQFPATATTGAKKPVDATRVWTNVKAGERVSGLSITLAHGGASFRGQMAVGEGEEVPKRTFVYLAPVERERSESALNYFGVAVDSEGKIAMNNIPPGRYWIFAETISEDLPAPLLRIRFPHETDTRAQIRRNAEAAKTEIEFKPCQEVVDFKLALKP